MLTLSRRFGNEEILVAINMSNRPFSGSVEAKGNFEEITPNFGQPLPPDDEKAKPQAVALAALPALNLDAYGYRIFRPR